MQPGLVWLRCWSSGSCPPDGMESISLSAASNGVKGYGESHDVSPRRSTRKGAEVL